MRSMRPLPAINRLHGLIWAETPETLSDVRVSPPEADVGLALHSAPQGGGQHFYHSACEVPDGAAEVVLPWREFMCADGQLFDAQATAWVNLQVCLPSGRLTRGMAVEIEAVDTVALKRLF